MFPAVVFFVLNALVKTCQNGADIGYWCVRLTLVSTHRLFINMASTCDGNHWHLWQKVQWSGLETSSQEELYCDEVSTLIPGTFLMSHPLCILQVRIREYEVQNKSSDRKEVS